MFFYHRTKIHTRTYVHCIVFTCPQARYSMVYAQHLRERGNQFMKVQFLYDPGTGNGRVPPRSDDRGYLSVHLRRNDYVHARSGKDCT